MFGKENPLEDSAKGFSAFGGRLEGNESPYEGALREGAEELTGFLGDKEELDKVIKRQGKMHTLVLDKYHLHMFYYPYDKSLVKYYNQNHAFLWKHLDTKTLQESKLFEKIEIQWFEAKTLKKQLNKFRPFYRKIVLKLIEDMGEIEEFVRSKKKHTRTEKNRV